MSPLWGTARGYRFRQQVAPYAFDVVDQYGWSAKLALSILTDFEELSVYDCTMRPRPNEKASHARIQYFQFEEYPDRWRELGDVFSREAVWSRSSVAAGWESRTKLRISVFTASSRSNFYQSGQHQSKGGLCWGKGVC